MQIMSYPEIAEMLSRLPDRMQRILHQNLIGLYLYGSLVTGDFDPEISDIDMLSVTSYDIDDREFEQLHKMHNRLVAENPKWQGRIDIQYLTVNALKTFKTQSSQIAVISPGEPFHIKAAGREWLLNWYLVREQGRVLWGPPPQTIVPPISHAEFLEATREHAQYWAEWAKQPCDQRGQSYAVLTLCRALYACRKGAQPSKEQAAFWVQAQFPQWTALIQRAFGWRKDADADLRGHEASFPETARFIQFVVDRMA